MLQAPDPDDRKTSSPRSVVQLLLATAGNTTEGFKIMRRVCKENCGFTFTNFPVIKKRDNQLLVMYRQILVVFAFSGTKLLTVDDGQRLTASHFICYKDTAVNY